MFLRFNVWAVCSAGYYLNGFRLKGRRPPKFLSDIEEGKCCRPRNHPHSYEDCYDADVSSSFDTGGWSECQRAGYYMTGFYKSNCNDLNCIDKFRCCKMNKGKYILSDSLLNKDSELKSNATQKTFKMSSKNCSVHEVTSYNQSVSHSVSQ